jgi:hypothetical protein
MYNILEIYYYNTYYKSLLSIHNEATKCIVKKIKHIAGAICLQGENKSK